MIFWAMIILFLPMFLMLQQSAYQQRQQSEEPAPAIEYLAVLRRDFVDPDAPDRVLAGSMVPTHARITRGGKTWEVGGMGEPIQTVRLQFTAPVRLRSGALAYSTDDLLAKDKREGRSE